MSYKTKRPTLRALASLSLAVNIALCSCGSPSPGAEEKHLAVIRQPGNFISLDMISNASVMKVDRQETGKTAFCSFLLRWEDSVIRDAKQEKAREKYFEYDMEKDWVAVVAGDSVMPVFFQPKPGLNRQVKEGVIVFELPRGRLPETLLYRNSCGPGGAQVVVLNRK